MKTFSSWALIGIVLSLWNCSGPSYVQKDDIRADLPLLNKVVFSLNPNYDAQTIQCVAVLPFASIVNAESVFTDVIEDPSVVMRRSFFCPSGSLCLS